MAFEPGKSGNPGGRPKNPFGELIRKATNEGEDLVKVVLKILKTSKSEKSKLHAAEWLRDTGWNKPVQGIRSVDEDGNDVQPAIHFVPAGKKR